MNKPRTLNKRGRLFVVSSPSGGGKTTLGQKILKTMPGIIRSVSMTTRAPRKKEKHGRDYFFVTEKEFRREKEKKGFLESATVFGFRYGTPRRFVERVVKRGLDVLLLIDVQGAMQVRRAWRAESTLIFIMPPSMRELKKRLVGRSTDSSAVVRTRLKIARQEMRLASRYDYVIENRRLGPAVRALSSVIAVERLKT